jgi:hypothetical protein
MCGRSVRSSSSLRDESDPRASTAVIHLVFRLWDGVHSEDMRARIDDDGRVRYDDLGTPYEWASLQDLAADYWRWQRLPRQEQEDDRMAAWSCVDDLMDRPAPVALDVIEALLILAKSDQERCDVGAGPLEDLLSHRGHGERFVDEVERRARNSPGLRDALSCLYLGHRVPADVRERLEPPSRWK